MSTHDTSTTERRKQNGHAITWIAVCCGIAAIVSVVNGTEKYASLPRELDRQQKQITELSEAVVALRAEMQEDRKLMGTVSGQLALLIQQSRFGNQTRP